MTYKKILFVGFCVLTLFTTVKSVSAETTYTESDILCSTSQNLFDNQFLDNTWYDVSNNIFSLISFDGTYISSHLIAIDSSKNYDYYFNFNSQAAKSTCGNSSFRFIYFDSSLNYISNSFFPYRFYNAGGVITPPSNAAYVAIAVPDSCYSIVYENGFLVFFEDFSRPAATCLDDETFLSCSTSEPDTPATDTPSDNTESTSTDYSIFYSIAILIAIIFLYKFLDPYFYRKV